MNIEQRILYEDNHLIAVNKEPCELSQKDTMESESLIETIKRYLKKKYDKKGEVFLGVIHRLDRVSSGAIIYAKTSKSLVRMNEVFKNKNVCKIYHAITTGKIENSGQIIGFLKKDPKRNISIFYKNEVKGSKIAILKYKILKAYNNFNLLEIKIETGRHHQIRAQLGFLGVKIRGDVKYGYENPLKYKGINLHAVKISFIHPVKKETITINAPYPCTIDPFWNSFV